MKRKMISNILSEINDEYVVEANETVVKRTQEKTLVWKRIGGVAACAAIIAVTVLGAWNMKTQKKNDDIFMRPWDTKIVSAENVGSSIKMKTWDEKTISEKFWIFNYNSMTYSSRVTKIDDEKVGEAIADVTLNGIDEINDISYTSNGIMYSINGISEKCAVAINFAEDKNYYVYVNSYYKPETLSEFMAALNLKENASFGAVYFTRINKDKTVDTLEFTGLEEDYVWSVLLNNSSSKNVENYDRMQFGVAMTVSVDVPILGYKNISLGFTEDGYITTNILDTGKAFFIGEDKTEVFKNYVIDNCQGKKLVYVYDAEEN